MHPLGIADQIKLAFQVTTRRPAVAGAVFGGIVPLLAFAFSHFGPPLLSLKGALSAGFVALCLGYSVPKVVKWGRQIFQAETAGIEAWCFALIMECGMVLAGYIGDGHPVFLAVSIACLAILVTVNALSTACSAALGQRAATEAKREAARNPDTLSLVPSPAPVRIVRAPRRTAAKRKAGGR